MKTKNTCRYYCAVDIKTTRFKDTYLTTYFYKQKRKAIMLGEKYIGKDNYIIVFWDFELPKKEVKK